MTKKLGAKIAGTVRKIGAKDIAGHARLGTKWVASKVGTTAHEAGTVAHALAKAL